MNKIAKDHAEFLSDFAYNLGRLFGTPDDEMDAVSEFVQWFAEATITHGIKHGIEWVERSNGQGAEMDNDQGAEMDNDQGVERNNDQEKTPTQADIARLWNENEQRYRRNSNL